MPSNLQLKTAAPTDFWRKPPGLNVATAPTHLRTYSSKEFRRARVTISAQWTRLYDQGGLFVYLPATAGSTDDSERFWIKSGIEYYNDRVNLSTVAAREWADWSLLPLEESSVTIEIEREQVNPEKGKGSSLWVYLVEGDERTAVREITWAFETEGEISVGVYAARPTTSDAEDGEELAVSFEDLLVEG